MRTSSLNLLVPSLHFDDAMAEYVKKAVECLEKILAEIGDANEKVDGRLVRRLESDLTKYERILDIYLSGWERKPVEELKSNKGLYTIAMEAHKKWGFGEFGPDDTIGFVKKLRWENKDMSMVPHHYEWDWYVQLFKLGLIERKRQPFGGGAYYIYRFTEEDVKNIENVINESKKREENLRTRIKELELDIVVEG